MKIKTLAAFTTSILLLALSSCKKSDFAVPSSPSSEKLSSISAYYVHATIRKLEALGGGQYNYEFSFWVTTDLDSLTALELPGDLKLNGSLVTGSGNVTSSIILKQGSVISHKLMTLNEPVSVIGQFSAPGSYMGKPIYSGRTFYEQPYNLKKIHVQGTGFADSDGKSFLPWGFNYTNTNQLPLVDYDWYKDSIWEIIKQDIREMKAMDINIIRIHLQYNRFMTGPNTPNEDALVRLKELVDFAAIYGLYVDITGLGCYFKVDSPVWYDVMSEEERWATQAVFWGAVARTVNTCNNVFCYDLMNEPVTPSRKTDEWLPGEPFGGYNFVQNITRTPNGRSWITVTHQWISTLKPAIRMYDTETMVTVGFIGLGIISRFNDLLDYNSAHIYPETGKIHEAIQFVEDNVTEKPLVIEETGPLGSGFEDMELFITSIEPITSGIISHFQGQTIAELMQSNNFLDIYNRQWYRIFTRDLNPFYNKPVY